MTSLGSATVGIQNGTIANLYEFDGVRNSTERGVQDERAIAIGGHEALPFGTLEGTVTDATTLLPIPGATVKRAGGSEYATSDSAGHYLMNLLEDKGHLKHKEVGRKYVYYAKLPREKVRRTAVKNLLRTFFDGSVEQAVSQHCLSVGANFA